MKSERSVEQGNVSGHEDVAHSQTQVYTGYAQPCIRALINRNLYMI